MAKRLSALEAARGYLSIGRKSEHPVPAVIDADSGKVVASQKNSHGDDGVIFDPNRPVNRRARPFFPSRYVDNRFAVLTYAPS